MSSLTFLGTGGGRYVTQSQVRYTGGIWLEADSKNFIIDPGVGALIRAIEFNKDLSKLDAVLVSHKHVDHYNDAEVCIEGMTAGMNEERGTVFINEDATDHISEYHRSLVNFKTFSKYKTYDIEGIEVETIPTFDHDNAYGFKFYLKDGIITYASDTNYNPNLAKNYMGSDILILNVLMPDEYKINKHLCLSEAKKIIEESKPKKAIITHFGYPFVEMDMSAVALEVEQETKIKTIAAEDGMVLKL